ncbi:MAG: helical backbone metal receptor [Burkholderiaceae bacterium]|jgi:iron complex transport system substrate-binding protein|nr:helical backbone metal receptor [Burkholderiaceae bacterium]
MQKGWLALLALLCCALAARAADAMPPTRIVSLLPSLTETVCALGACQRLVAVDRYSNWPPPVQKLPQAGSGLTPDVEVIATLRPDLVLLSPASPAKARLRALGLNVVELEPHTSAEMRRTVVALGQLLRVDGAEALLHDMDVGVQVAARSLPASARGTRVYFEVSPAPYAAGRDSFIGGLMEALGLVNVIGPEFGPFPRINPEYVVRAAPDLIIASRAGLADMPHRPGWATMRALRAGRTCSFDGSARDMLVRPGPRMAEAAQLLANCVSERMAAQP